MVTETLNLGQALTLKNNIIYALPANASQVSWQSPIGGSPVLVSIDGINFSSLGTAGPNEVKSVFTSAIFIKSTEDNTIVVAKSINGTIIEGGGGNGGGGVTYPLLIPDGTKAAPSLARASDIDTGFHFTNQYASQSTMAFSQNGEDKVWLCRDGIRMKEYTSIAWTKSDDPTWEYSRLSYPGAGNLNFYGSPTTIFNIVGIADTTTLQIIHDKTNGIIKAGSTGGKIQIIAQNGTVAIEVNTDGTVSIPNLLP